jgi:hypothetical protein
VSNPFEVAKTRLQLQGELAKGGGVKVYNNALDLLAKTWRNEGLRGLQRGLGPAVSLSFSVGTCINSEEIVCIPSEVALLMKHSVVDIQRS